MNFHNTTIHSITASSNGQSTNFRLATCEDSPVILSTSCQSGMNPLWNDGVTIQTGYMVTVPINDAKAKNIIIKGNLNFQNVSHRI